MVRFFNFNCSTPAVVSADSISKPQTHHGGRIRTWGVACIIALALLFSKAQGQSSSETIRKQYLSFLDEKFSRLPFLREPVEFEEIMFSFDDSDKGFVSKFFYKVSSHEPDYSVRRGWNLRVKETPTSSLIRDWKLDFEIDSKNSIILIVNPAYRAQIIQKNSDYVMGSVSKRDDLSEFRGFYTPINHNLNEFRGPRWAMPDLIVDANSEDVSFLQWEDGQVGEFEVKILIYRRPIVHRKPNHDEIRTIYFAKDDGRILLWKAALAEKPNEIVDEAKLEYTTLDGRVVPSFYESKEYTGKMTITLAKAYRNFKFLKAFDKQAGFLSNYGIVEPDWYRPPRPWWLYSSLIGMAVLIVGAIVLRYGKSRWHQS